jgi:CheY-like chemotaxis protein
MIILERSSSTGKTWKHDAASIQDHTDACQIMERTLRVLLVEDAPFLRYAFGRLLRLEGFEVKEVNDGREALDSLSAFQPDLVLTDLMMPVMGGVELISKIRSNPATAAIPVVAITADATEQAERNARKAGAVDVITKPVDLTALLDRLRVLVH